jgi:uncharacterized protein (TIGR02284 family)
MEGSKELLIDLEQLSSLQVDSINGFKYLVEEIKEDALKNFFAKSEEQSTALWNEINDEIIKLQGDIKTKGTLKGALNHLWMKLKTDIANSDLSSLLTNIEACEEFNRSRYKQILAGELPGNIKMILQKHLDILNVRMETIGLLKKSLEK